MTIYAPAYYFVLPDSETPVGGANVAVAMINQLNAAGYRAAPLYGSPHYQYRFAQCDVAAVYDPRLAPAARKHLGRRQRVLDLVTPRFGKGTDVLNAVLELRPQDVIVMPEYWYPELCDLFPLAPRILLAQDVFGLLQASQRDRARKTPVQDSFNAVITTSAASRTAYEYLSGHSSFEVPVVVSKPNLISPAHKKKQITYFKRKRHLEAELLPNLLSRSEVFADWSFVEIKDMTEDEVVKTLSDSLIFLSFSSREGFGLPAAEAMAAGCLVVGYTGVGGEEYFTKDVAFPVPDSDIIAFAKTVETVAQEYEKDPKRLDVMRHAATERVLNHYSPDVMSKALLQAWTEIHTRHMTPKT